MKISKVRGGLYDIAKFLGDVQAIDKSLKTGTIVPVGKRVRNRIVGRLASRLLWGRLFR